MEGRKNQDEKALLQMFVYTMYVPTILAIFSDTYPSLASQLEAAVTIVQALIT